MSALSSVFNPVLVAGDDIGAPTIAGWIFGSEVSLSITPMPPTLVILACAVYRVTEGGTALVMKSRKAL